MAQQVPDSGSTLRQILQPHLELPAEPSASERVFRAEFGYDNAGNNYTGPHRVIANVDVVDPFGWNDVLSLGGIKEFAGTGFARIDYDVALPWGIRFNAGYSHLEFDPGGQFTALDASGNADTVQAGLRYPLASGSDFNIMTIGDFEYSDLEDRVGAAGTATDRYYFTLAWELAGDFRDGLFGGGVNAFSLRWTAGELDIGTDEAAIIDDLTYKRDEVFQRWNLQFLRLQPLTDRLSLYLSLTTQKGDGNLDSSQKLVAGGPDGVRAFQPGEASGDAGLILTGELRYELDAPAIPGSLQLAAFFDRSHLTLHEDPLPGEENHRNLNAAGLSITWQRTGDFFARAMFAHRLGGSAPRTDPGDDARIWLEATKHF